jgi:citronellol/citronellal dehydrogenase
LGSMEGRVAVITGASRGIGAHIAELFAVEGAAVALVARTAEPGTSRLPGSLEEVVGRIRGRGGQAVAVRADLTDPDDLESIAARATEALGPVDTLVNNAGVNFYGPALAVTARRYGLMFQINVHAPFRLCQVLIPGMVQRGRGWVLNITSKQARNPKGPPYPDWARDGSVPYGMCKTALERLTTGLAAELEGTDGPYLAISHAAPYMMRQRSGSIINVTARAAGFMPKGDRAQGSVAYAVSKAALNRLSYFMAEELRPYGIAVNALSPGIVATDTAVAARPELASSGSARPATPEALGPALVCLAQQTAETLTGQILHTDEFQKSWP